MIVGIDEVGRGSWAGPLVVAAVALGGDTIDGLTDSKKLSPKRRQQLTRQIKQTAPLVGIGWVSARQIDEHGLSAALYSATQQAFAQIDCPEVEQIIIDGTIKLIDDPRVTTMKQADLLVPSVSAASIIAKTARDSYMSIMDQAFEGYGFAAHVGYGTTLHRQAIEDQGVTPLHRLSFGPLRRYQAAQPVADVDSFVPTGIERIGDSAEDAATDHLKSLGHQICHRNWKTKLCEIDIVSRHKGVLYFTEVKYRRQPGQGGGMAAITPTKLDQMKFATRVYCQYLQIEDTDLRLAVASMSGQPPAVEQWLELVD